MKENDKNRKYVYDSSETRNKRKRKKNKWGKQIEEQEWKEIMKEKNIAELFII